MVFATILFIIILLVLAIIAMKVLHSILKAGITIILLLLVVSVIFGFFIVKDANDFKTTFSNEATTYALSEGGNIITGFETTAFNFGESTTLNTSEIEERIANVKSNSAKIFIFKKEALDFSLPTNENISLDDLLQTEDNELRANTFKIGLANTIKEEGPLFLIHKARDNTLEILPRTILVKTMKFAPKTFAKKIGAKMTEGKEKITTAIQTTSDKMKGTKNETEESEELNEETKQNETTNNNTNTTEE